MIHFFANNIEFDPEQITICSPKADQALEKLLSLYQDDALKEKAIKTITTGAILMDGLNDAQITKAYYAEKEKDAIADINASQMATQLLFDYFPEFVREFTARGFDASISRVISQIKYFDAAKVKSNYFQIQRDEVENSEEAKQIIELYEKISNVIYDVIYKTRPESLPEVAIPRKPELFAPKTIKMPNAKLINSYGKIQNALIRTDPDGQLSFIHDYVDVFQGKDKKKKEILTLCSISYDGELTGHAKKINNTDLANYDIVCSLWEAGNTTFSLNDIYREKTRKTKQPSKAESDRLKRSMHKLAATRVNLDISNEIEAGYLEIDGKRITGVNMSDTWLSFIETEFTLENGQKITGYKLKGEPFIYGYCKAKGQIISIPAHFLELPEKMKATEETIVIRNYLLKAINQMTRGHRNNKSIKYSSILDAIGADLATLTRTEKSRYTERIKKILDFYKEKGIIKSYRTSTGARGAINDFIITPINKDAYEKALAEDNA